MWLMWLSSCDIYYLSHVTYSHGLILGITSVSDKKQNDLRHLASNAACWRPNEGLVPKRIFVSSLCHERVLNCLLHVSLSKEHL